MSDEVLSKESAHGATPSQPTLVSPPAWPEFIVLDDGTPAARRLINAVARFVQHASQSDPAAFDELREALLTTRAINAEFTGGDAGRAGVHAPVFRLDDIDPDGPGSVETPSFGCLTDRTVEGHLRLQRCCVGAMSDEVLDALLKYLMAFEKDWNGFDDPAEADLDEQVRRWGGDPAALRGWLRENWSEWHDLSVGAGVTACGMKLCRLVLPASPLLGIGDAGGDAGDAASAESPGT